MYLTSLKSMTAKISSGYFSRFKRIRHFLFVFSYTEGWWDKYLRGFTHVTLFELLDKDYAIGLDPTLIDCRMIVRPIPTAQDLQGFTVLAVKVRVTRRNRLILPILQTCATIVQYHAGISLGCITAQALYEKLLLPEEELKPKGIKEVIQWAKPLKDSEKY